MTEETKKQLLRNVWTQAFVDAHAEALDTRMSHDVGVRYASGIALATVDVAEEAIGQMSDATRERLGL